MGVRERVKHLIDSNTVVVFSKSYCGFCSQVKHVLHNLGVKAKILELDNESDGEEVQSVLYSLTQQRTVPNVFIGGEHIGGCSEVMSLRRDGSLEQKLVSAGAM